VISPFASIDKGVVRFAAHARLAYTEIERIFEQSWIIRSNVDRDRETKFRRDTCASGIEGRLSVWNTHAADAEIAKTENPFAVGHDNEPYVLLWPIGKQLRDAAPGRNRHVNSMGGMEDMVELLRGLANGRRVDKRHKPAGIGHQDHVVKSLISRLQV
jgi:hypothetical protein